MIKLPNKFEYGHLKYEIVGVPEMNSSDDGSSLGGEHRQHEGRIFIITNSNHTPEYIRMVLLHEILHAISKAQGLGLEENQVSGLAFGFIQALQQNTWMGEFFT